MDYEKRKDEILTNFFNSGVLKVKTDGHYKGKLRVSRSTKVAEEMYLNTLYQLSKFDAEKLVKAYDENPKSIEALAVTILKRQYGDKKQPKITSGSTVTEPKKIKKASKSKFKIDEGSRYKAPKSPNNSFGSKLIFGSNYFSDDYISPTDTYNESGSDEDYRGIPISDGEYFTDRDYSVNRVEAIFQRLTEDETEFVKTLWEDGTKTFYKTKPTKAYKEYRDYILNKIKNMDLNKGLTPLEQIKAKLTKSENEIFDVMWNEELTRKDKMKKLKFSEQQYTAQRRILLKRIKALNIK